MATTTAADLTAGQIAMVGEARFTIEHRAVCTNLFTRVTLGPGEKSIYYPKFGKVTAKDLTDGVDMAEAQSLTITGTTHVTDEAGCKVIITKKLRQQFNPDAYRAAGKVIGNAMTKKIDGDGLALFSGVSDGVGVATTSMTLGYILAAVSQLKGQSEPAPEPFYCVMHPYTFDPIVDQIGIPATDNFPPEFQMSVLKNYWVGNTRLFNVPMFQDGNISIDSSDDAYGVVASKMAFIYLVGWEPESWVEEDKSLRGWEIGIVADYGMVEEDDAYARYLLFDASKPTS